ncbi:terpenoid synthase [Cubamyces menziesii]|nr:terpenoid synthase [Cubamyces menziesii]
MQFRSSAAEETKRILCDFLARMGYRSPDTAANATLRSEVAAEIVSWNADLDPAFVKATIDTSSSIAESAYGHTSYKHQLLIAIYTAFVAYVDDLGQHNVEALGQVVRWFVARDELPDPVLKRMLLQFEDMYEYYPRFSADAINTSTLEALLGMYIECVSKDMVVVARATLYPSFLRLKTGIGTGFGLFNFIKDWRDPSDNYYLQLIPAIEQYINAINDILSFYKETLQGETDTYIHLRAAAEQKEPMTVLRELVEETLDNIRNIEVLTSTDQQLADICRRHLMGYVEFHFRAKRYRLTELHVDCQVEGTPISA